MVALPDFLKNDSGLIPIDLLASRDLELDVVGENGVERLTESNPEEGESVSTVPPVDEAMLKRKVAELSLGENLRVPSPDLLAPPALPKEAPEERIRQIRESPFYEHLAKAFEESRQPTGEYGGLEHSVTVSPDILKKQGPGIDPGTERVLGRMTPSSHEGSLKERIGREFEITGPATRRGLVHVPTIPDLKVNGDVGFEMRFWVRPNGTVDRVVLLKGGGDAELERLATEYFLRWQFDPLPQDEPQIEEWGTVTIHFGVQRESS